MLLPSADLQLPKRKLTRTRVWYDGRIIYATVHQLSPVRPINASQGNLRFLGRADLYGDVYRYGAEL
jgi:hypothetical protein